MDQATRYQYLTQTTTQIIPGTNLWVILVIPSLVHTCLTLFLWKSVELLLRYGILMTFFWIGVTEAVISLLTKKIIHIWMWWNFKQISGYVLSTFILMCLFLSIHNRSTIRKEPPTTGKPIFGLHILKKVLPQWWKKLNIML